MTDDYGTWHAVEFYKSGSEDNECKAEECQPLRSIFFESRQAQKEEQDPSSPNANHVEIITPHRSAKAMPIAFGCGVLGASEY
jgi:hypothetical protein